MRYFIRLSIIVNLLISHQLFAQKTVALQHNGTSSFYSKIDSAVIHALDGDTIYISGGSFAVSDLIINKRLTIYGAGLHPDTTKATEQTYLSGNLRLVTGGDFSFIQGFYITGNIYFGTNTQNDDVHGVTISRCYMSSAHLGMSTSSKASNLLFEECIINGNVVGNNAQNVLFSNNLISGIIQTFNQNAVFNNNVLLFNSNQYSSCLQNITESTFSNNIFLDETGYVFNCAYSSCNTSLFKNNLFVFNYTFPVGDNIGSGNLVNVSRTSIFENQTGSSLSFAHDYHLKLACVGNDSGTDGSDIGIYGGIYPFKDGSNPINPHIKTKNISSTTGTTGKIGVNINVNAQDN